MTARTWICMVVVCACTRPILESPDKRPPSEIPTNPRLSVMVVGATGCFVSAGATAASARLLGQAPVISEPLPAGSRSVTVSCPEGSYERLVQLDKYNHMKLVVRRDMLH